MSSEVGEYRRAGVAVDIGGSRALGELAWKPLRLPGAAVMWDFVRLEVE